MLYTCRVTQIVEREVVVEAQSERQARRVAERPQDWIDHGTATTVAVECESADPHESERDCMDEWKYRIEGE